MQGPWDIGEPSSPCKAYSTRFPLRCQVIVYAFVKKFTNRISPSTLPRKYPGRWQHLVLVSAPGRKSENPFFRRHIRQDKAFSRSDIRNGSALLGLACSAPKRVQGPSGNAGGALSIVRRPGGHPDRVQPRSNAPRYLWPRRRYASNVAALMAITLAASSISWMLANSSALWARVRRPGP